MRISDCSSDVCSSDLNLFSGIYCNTRRQCPHLLRGNSERSLLFGHCGPYSSDSSLPPGYWNSGSPPLPPPEDLPGSVLPTDRFPEPKHGPTDCFPGKEPAWSKKRPL